MSPAFHAFLVIGGVMAMGHNVAASGTRMPWKIGEATAKRLAAEAVYGADKYLDSYDFDKNDGFFIIFNTISKPPAEGGFGFFAVSLWTGDVWALWGCRRLSTPALRQSQAAIRQHFTRTELKQYARLRRLKPLCIVED